MAGSTLAARALGRRLTQHRLRAKLNRSQAAKIVETSLQTFGRLEEGQRPIITDIWINLLADAYRVSQPERRELLALAQEMRASQKAGGNWWRGYADDGMSADFDHYMNLEQSARRMTTWHLALLPGLLQTPDYRRANAWAEVPTRDHDAIEGLVRLAVNRQARWSDPSFEFEVLLSEAVLHHQVGSRAVMIEQFERLLEVMQLPNVTIRIIPFAASSTIGLIVGPFVLMEFAPLPTTKIIEPPVVFVEGYAGALYLELEGDVQLYRGAVSELRRVALGEAETRDLILAAMKERQ